MSGLPDWLGVYAGLDDAALATLANPGLVRRGRGEVNAGRVSLVEAGPSEVVVACGTPPVLVTMLAAGPRAARCPCPVAGVCVHVVAACLWARGAASDVAAAEPGSGAAAGADGEGAAGTGATTGAGRADADADAKGSEGAGAGGGADAAGSGGEVKGSDSAGSAGAVAGARVGAAVRGADAAGSDAAGADGAATSVGAVAPTSAAGSVLAEVLDWRPAEVNRAVGIAAVRRVAAASGLEADTDVSESGSTLAIRWPGSPEVVVVRGAGPRGMLVAGSHSEVSEAAWRLEAVVRVFARAGHAWDWPEAMGSDTIAPGQREIAGAVQAEIEGTVAAGLSHAGPRAADAIESLGHRARLEELPLLSRLLRSASGALRRLAARSDESSEASVLSVLARAWALAGALRATDGVLPERLVGKVTRGGASEAESLWLTPLGARWWTAASGARGVTVTFWNEADQRVESVTAGRAGGADPGFQRSLTRPLVWGASVEALTAGVIQVAVERRDDDTLNPTARTRVQATAAWPRVDIDGLTRAVDAARSGAEAAGFGAPRARVRVLPIRRFGVGPLSIDEVRQEVVWTLTAKGGETIGLRLDSVGTELNTITWLLARRAQIAAVTVRDGRCDGVFVRERDGLALVVPTLAAVSEGTASARLRERLAKLRTEQPLAAASGPTGPVEALCDDVQEVVTGLAASGERPLSSRESGTLAARAGAADDLGLATLARALTSFGAGAWHARDVLQATVIIDRVRALAS